MSTLTRIAATVRVTLDACARARQALREASTSLERAAEQLDQVLQGVGDQEAARAPALLSDAARTSAETYRALLDVESRAHSFLANLGLDTAGVTDTSTYSSSVPPTPGRIEQLRRELPPSVEHRSGRKTHGRWTGPDGQSHSMVSGQDRAYDEAIQVFRDMKSRHVPQRASDVEMQLAAHMRKNGIRSAVLVINHTPCPGPMGCDALVPVILPKGYTLTVYGANGFVRQYEGGGTSSWVP